MKKENLIALLFLLGTLLFNSCEESLNADVSTTLSKKITADIVTGKKSADDLFLIPYSVIDTMNIEDNADVKKNMEKIKDMNISKVSCKITGIPTGESIPELNIVIPEAYISISLSDVVDNNTLIMLDITDELLTAAAAIMLETHEIAIMVNGFSSYAPMQLGVELSFETKLKISL